MEIKNDIQLAEMIIQLDLLRDQLYEDLQNSFGSNASEFLRNVQNGRSQQNVSLNFSIEERRGISLALLEVMFITAKHKKMVG